MTGEDYQLPNGYALATIGDVVGPDGLFCDGDWVESKDQDPNGDVRLTQLADVGDGIYRDKSSRFLTYEKAVQLGCTFLQTGDLMIARMPDPLGRACIFPGDTKPAVTVVDVCVVRTGADGASHKWLMHALNSPKFRSAIASMQSGSTRKRISKGNLTTIAFPLPALPEQHRIVANVEEMFTRLDAGEEALRQVKAQLVRYRQSVLKSAFDGSLTAEWRAAHRDELEPASALLERIGEERRENTQGKLNRSVAMDTSALPDLPEGWVWTTLGDVSFRITKGSTPTSYGFNYTSSGINFVKVENLRNGRIDRNSLSSFIDKAAHEFLKRSQLELDDVLFSIAGTIGKVAVVHCQDLPANTNQAVSLIRCPWQFVRPKYLAYVLDSSIGRRSIQSRPRGIGMNNVSLGDVNSILLPLSPTFEQRRVVEEIERRFSVAAEIERAAEENLRLASGLRQSILKAAFDGKLAPQDPNDEPAEKLLERIAAERARSSPRPTPKRTRNRGD